MKQKIHVFHLRKIGKTKFGTQLYGQNQGGISGVKLMYSIGIDDIKIPRGYGEGLPLRGDADLSVQDIADLQIAVDMRAALNEAHQKYLQISYI